MTPKEALEILDRVRADEKPMNIGFTTGQLFDLILILQQVVKTPIVESGDAKSQVDIKSQAKSHGRMFQQLLAARYPEINELFDAGWFPEKK